MKKFPFVLIDGSILTIGVRVVIDGIDIAQFERNPVALYQHNDWSMPVGVWENIRKENGQLLADFVPDYADPDPEVKRLIGKVERGVIKMASAGLVDLEASDDPMLRVEGQSDVTITKCRLREASIVAIGKNHNALRLYDKQGAELLPEHGKLNLSDYLTTDENKKQNENLKMKKETLTALNLADTATEAQIEEAVELLLSDRKKAVEQAKELQDKLDAIDAEAKKTRKAEAEKLVDAAIKDGRLNETETGATKKSWLELFDSNHEQAKAMLEGLPKRVSAGNTLPAGDSGDDNKPKISAWDKRQQEIEENSKKK